jgi:hypothetical protein
LGGWSKGGECGRVEPFPSQKAKQGILRDELKDRILFRNTEENSRRNG